jgi:hypothetical protein
VALVDGEWRDVFGYGSYLRSGERMMEERGGRGAKGGGRVLIDSCEVGGRWEVGENDGDVFMSKSLRRI